MIYRHWKTGEVIDYDVHNTVQIKKHATARFHRAHLHQALLENLPEGIVHLGKTTVDVKADPDKGATLYFEDGTTTTADIVVGADGLRSVCFRISGGSRALTPLTESPQDVCTRA